MGSFRRRLHPSGLAVLPSAAAVRCSPLGEERGGGGGGVERALSNTAPIRSVHVRAAPQLSVLAVRGGGGGGGGVGGFVVTCTHPSVRVAVRSHRTWSR